MTRYVFNYAEVDYKDRLLMTNLLPLIVFFWKCLYGNYDVDVNEFVSFFSIMVGAPLITRMILDF